MKTKNIVLVSSSATHFSVATPTKVCESLSLKQDALFCFQGKEEIHQGINNNIRSCQDKKCFLISPPTKYNVAKFFWHLLNRIFVLLSLSLKRSDHFCFQSKTTHHQNIVENFFTKENWKCNFLMSPTLAQGKCKSLGRPRRQNFPEEICSA